jgi:DNA-binding SARP family transcriptional activator
MALQLRVAGRMAIDTDSGPVDEALLGGRRGRAAFALLAIEHARPVSREELAEMIWPGELPPTWESAVRAAVSKVRGFLAVAGLTGDVVASAFGSYQLHLPVGAVVDVEAAERDVREALGALGDRRPVQAAERAAAARAVLSRPLLVGLEGDWVEAKRSTLQGLLVVALETPAVEAAMATVWGWGWPRGSGGRPARQRPLPSR